METPTCRDAGAVGAKRRATAAWEGQGDGFVPCSSSVYVLGHSSCEKLLLINGEMHSVRPKHHLSYKWGLSGSCPLSWLSAQPCISHEEAICMASVAGFIERRGPGLFW